jgi:hypothetical protein
MITENPKWVEVHENGEMIGGYWDCGSFRCSDSFMKALENHPVIRGNTFTGVWIDEFVNAFAKEDKEKKQRKQVKPKHKVPFWVQDWREK